MDSDFSPVILPEDTAPPEAAGYAECEVCAKTSRVIWGEGNPDASIVVILDNPGAREDKEGREYVCGTRQTLQKAIFQANLDIADIYITYLLKCRPFRTYDKKRARAFSKPYLIRQIEALQPKFLVCLGDVVVQTMFDDENADVKSLRGLWHATMGYRTMVSYHPLAVRRRPNLTGLFILDWEMLAERYFSEKSAMPVL
jgi:uracil-DNA glycosylase family 4